MNLLHLACIFTFLVLEVTAQCPDMYTRYSKEHTYCKPINLSCKLMNSSVSEEDKEAILDEHNMLRSKIATGQQANMSPASDMLQMVWDDELADIAQKHADLCLFDYDCDNCRRVKNFGVGQNIIIQALSKNQVPTPDWRDMINGWYDEVERFQASSTNETVVPLEVGTYGHFTQVVWSRSWRIGCGYAAYEEETEIKALYVCNYGPEGNIDNAIIYKSGTACSACPINSCCDRTCAGTADYLGLCKITDNKGPTYEQPLDNYFFYCDFQKQRDCDIDIKGTNKWLIHNTLSGNYLGTVLEGGEDTKIIFTNSLHPNSGSFCFVMNYRRGPDVDGQEDNSTLIQTFTVEDNDYKVPNKLSPLNPQLRHQFTEFSMSLGWHMETEVDVKFSVPIGKPRQYLEIKSVYAKEGSC